MMCFDKYILWYGYIYYLLFNIILFISLIGLFQFFFIKTITRLNLIFFFNLFFLSYIWLFFICTFIVLNQTLTYLNYLTYIFVNTSELTLAFCDNHLISENYCYTSLNLTLVQVYTYPFIYVFLIITILSIIYCLTYNTDELLNFMFYCQLILIAGYILFFTDSLILFFLAYELLLIPSFFILYKFAKTRRCVEAAYLMFFWTQFGALALIFALIYLYLLLNTLSFSIISHLYISSFEVNFIFLLLLIGFGVKLPI